MLHLQPRTHEAPPLQSVQHFQTRQHGGSAHATRPRERERELSLRRERAYAKCRTGSLDSSTSATLLTSICATLHTSICAAYIPLYAPYVHGARSVQSSMRYHEGGFGYVLAAYVPHTLCRIHCAELRCLCPPACGSSTCMRL